MPGYIDPFDRPPPAPHRSVVLSSTGGYLNPFYGRQPLGSPVREDGWGDADEDDGWGGADTDDAVAGSYDDGDGDDRDDDHDADDDAAHDHDERREGSCAAGNCGTDAFYGGFCWPHLMQHLMRLRNARFGRPQRRKKEAPQEPEHAPPGADERFGEREPAHTAPSFRDVP